MKYAFAASFALALAACAMPSRLPPGASEAQVRAVMGAPAMEFSAPDGSRQLAYPTGPLGQHTYMAYLTPDGRLDRVEQVLDDVRFQAIQPGMTKDELLRFIGPPFQTGRFPNLRQTAWDYRFRDTWGYEAILSVMLDDNDVVVGRVIQRIDRGRDRGGSRG
jgi:outer membrane protein assembly factor BamE (lipoprotein component of BamABCDE complex)